MAVERVQRRLAAILAADVVGYSRLMGEDEAGTLSRLKQLRLEVFDPHIKEFSGRLFKTTGDGLLIEFPSAVDAVNHAVAVQRALEAANADISDSIRLTFRIGISLGDVIVDGGDLYGNGVNVAARMEGLAEPGGICVSGTVFEHVGTAVDVVFDDLGPQKVKNITQPVRSYRVRLHDDHVQSIIGGNQPPALPDKPSIAVLPFENMSGDVEQEYFADGISEDIITSLSKLSQLLVIARNSSFTYKGRAVNVQEVARELGVRFVIEGSVRKSGNRVRITSQLIDCTTGGHLWAERFDRDLTDIFAVQDEVTQEIVTAMAVTLTADDHERIKTIETDNLEAYDYFLRGREHFWLQMKEDNLLARAMFEQARDLDPAFAPTYALLSFTHMMDYINRWNEADDQSLERAYEIAHEGVQLNESYPWSRIASGNAFLWNRQHDRAIVEYEKAIAQDPNFALGYTNLGWALHYAGRSAEAIELIKRGMRLDPHYPDIRLHWLAQSYFQLGQYEEAVELLKRRLIRKPDTDISRVLLAASYGHLGRTEEAKAEWAEALRVNPDYSLEHRRKILPYKNPADFEKVVQGLSKAGLPE
jgi:TolB-like protein